MASMLTSRPGWKEIAAAPCCGTARKDAAAFAGGGTMDDSFARYVAKYLMAKQGYAEGTVPEAQKLAAACDIVLTKADGVTFSAVCIVDAERDPSRRFGLDRDEVLAIGKACRARYAGTVNGAKMPASIEIVEVRESVTAEDRQRLEPLRSRFGTIVAALAVDVQAASVSVNAWSLLNFRRRQLGRLLKEPRVADGELVRPAPAALPESRALPILTSLMVAALAAVFVVEQLVAVAPGHGLFAPDVRTLVAMGGLSRRLVIERGEWFRLFTAPLLHGDLFHLLFNGIALWMAGALLEPLAGRSRLLALFFAGALGGSVLSMAVNPANLVSIGASGAIMGLFAAAVVLAYRFPAGAQRNAIHVGLLRVLVPSLIPLAAGSGNRIDFAAHLGGAAAGLLAGGFVAATWPRAAPRPRFAGAAVAAAVAAVAVLAWSAEQAREKYPQYAAAGRLVMPKDRFPPGQPERAQK